MLASAIFALSLTQTAVSPQLEPLHPALKISSDTFEKIWNKALADGQKKKGKDAGYDKMRRQIDSYHVSVLAKEACSWVYWMHPRGMIQMTANEAGQKYWPEADILSAKKELAGYSDHELAYLGFYFDLNSMPSFAGGYGRISRYANPDKLKDVRCVLKVGDRILQPEQQPGNITTSAKERVNFYSIPVTTYVRGTSSTSATAYGSGGTYATGTSHTRSSYQVTSHKSGSDDYTVYSGQATVLFATRDKDGKPLITPKDKTIEIKLVSDDGEVKTTYRLDDWTKAFE